MDVVTHFIFCRAQSNVFEKKLLSVCEYIYIYVSEVVLRTTVFVEFIVIAVRSYMFFVFLKSKDIVFKWHFQNFAITLEPNSTQYHCIIQKKIPQYRWQNKPFNLSGPIYE